MFVGIIQSLCGTQMVTLDGVRTPSYHRSGDESGIGQTPEHGGVIGANDSRRIYVTPGH